jgi:hypothetical protein
MMNQKAVWAGVVLSMAVCTMPLLAASAGECRRTMGGYSTIHEAQMAAQQAQYAGYQTSGVWGQGGIISDWSNRRYFFNVFFPC